MMGMYRLFHNPMLGFSHSEQICCCATTGVTGTVDINLAALGAGCHSLCSV